MIVTTTPNVEGKQIVEYKQVVFGEVIAGANFMRDFFAGITDVIGGRSSVYERRISRARQDALKELEEKAIALEKWNGDTQVKPKKHPVLHVPFLLPPPNFTL